MQERREFPRKRTTSLLEVVDVNTNEQVGNVVDISLAGLMLICNREIEDNSVFQLALKMPEDYEGDGRIEFGAEVLWAEISGDSNQFWVGFHIIDISVEAKSQFKAFVDNYV
jgi:hypothetical protein